MTKSRKHMVGLCETFVCVCVYQLIVFYEDSTFLEQFWFTARLRGRYRIPHLAPALNVQPQYEHSPSQRHISYN